MTNRLLFLIILCFLTVISILWLRFKDKNLRKKILFILCSSWILLILVIGYIFSKQYTFFEAIKTKNNDKAVAILNSHSPLITYTDIFGNTALHVAAENGNVSIINQLVEFGVNINAKNFNNIAPLHIAAYKGDLSLVRELINNKANIDIKGYRHDQTPLHIALISGKIDTAKLLCISGADVYMKNMLNKTPVDIAKEMGQKELVKFLVWKREDVKEAKHK